jgi:hypothetical protein
MRTLATYTRFAALLAAGITAAIGAAHAGGSGDDADRVNWNGFTRPFTRQSACTIQ